MCVERRPHRAARRRHPDNDLSEILFFKRNENFSAFPAFLRRVATKQRDVRTGRRFARGAAVKIGLLVIAVVIIVLFSVMVVRRRRSQRLREHLRVIGTPAESDLAAREQRHRKLDVFELEPAARRGYVVAWQATQTRFVDDPTGATREADTLVARVMRDRGYPIEDFEQGADDVSVDHPNVAENYRAAHALALANDQGLASTEELRQAFVHYGSLFAELLDIGQDGHRQEAQ
jgi:hypothetical protein